MKMAMSVVNRMASQAVIVQEVLGWSLPAHLLQSFFLVLENYASIQYFKSYKRNEPRDRFASQTIINWVSLKIH